MRKLVFQFVVFLALCTVVAPSVCGGVPGQRQHHAVNSRNEVESVWTWSEASSAGFPDGYTRTYLQDRNGNLISDGLFVYQYDAFNRLLQVNVPGSVVLDGDGRIVSGLLGGLILRYSYDAFGRLIRKYRPLNTTDYQTEDHYYDKSGQLLLITDFCGIAAVGRAIVLTGGEVALSAGCVYDTVGV